MREEAYWSVFRGFFSVSAFVNRDQESVFPFPGENGKTTTKAHMSRSAANSGAAFSISVCILSRHVAFPGAAAAIALPYNTDVSSGHTATLLPPDDDARRTSHVSPCPGPETREKPIKHFWDVFMHCRERLPSWFFKREATPLSLNFVLVLRLNVAHVK